MTYQGEVETLYLLGCPWTLKVRILGVQPYHFMHIFKALLAKIAT